MAYRVVTKVTPVAVPEGTTWSNVDDWKISHGPVGTGHSVVPASLEMDSDGISVIRTIDYDDVAQHNQHVSTKDADFGDIFTEAQISAGEV
jgi:hypothetical protein